MPTLKLLAFCPNLDPQTKEACGWDVAMNRRNGQGPALKEARFPYFNDGFVDIGLARDSFYAEDIVRATKGYAVADEQGNILSRFDKLDVAEKAMAGAKVRLTVDVDIPTEEEPVAEPKASKK